MKAPIHTPKIIIAGAPASGKGTQCELIKEKYGVIHLSTGDMLREAVKSGSELGTKAKNYMDSGKLVPDDLIIGVVRDRLAQPDCSEQGWLLDGFPRTENQAKALEAMDIVPDCFVVLDVPERVLVERVTGRRTDPETGRIYHLVHFPPESETVRKRLIQRSDDTEEKIKVRIKSFKENCEAVIGCYGKAKVLLLDGNRSKEEIFGDICNVLERSGERGDSNVKVLGSLVGFVVADVALRRLFSKLGIGFPSSLAGMVAFFAVMCTLPQRKAKVVVKAAQPGADLLTLWLPVFFAPSLITLPLYPAISREALLKLSALLIGGFVFSLSTTATFVQMLNTGKGKVRTNGSSLQKTAGKPVSPLDKNMLKSLTLGCAISAISALVVRSVNQGSALLPALFTAFMLLGTLSGYVGGVLLPASVRKVVHPVVTCTVVSWFLALAKGRVVGKGFVEVLKSYTTASKCPIHLGPGDLLLSLLGPSILSFAVQMYNRKKLLVQNAKAVVGGTMFASITGLFGTAVASSALNLPSNLRLATLSRTITSPLAMAIATALGAEVGMAVAIVVITGVIGANFGASLLDAIGIKDPIARGLSQGASAHGLGAASMANEPEAFPFAAIAMALTATFSTILVNIRPVKSSLVKLALGGVP